MRIRLLVAIVLVAALFSGASFLGAESLSPLARSPDWHRLDPYQGTMTRADFSRLLTTLYAPRGGWQGYLELVKDAAFIRAPGLNAEGRYTLHFAPDGTSALPWPAPYWRARANLPPFLPPEDHPLAGLRIALDPGHLGGRWAQLEERWFQIGNAAPVMEGEMALQVAHLLAERLRTLGAASVDLLRDSDEPATLQRPLDLLADARQALADGGVTEPRTSFGGPADPQRQLSVPWMSQMLFTRADIRARAGRINDALQPDIVICLHFDAEAWGDPARPALVEKNHLHVLVNGCYSPEEIAKDDVRLEMLLKLVDRSASEEIPLAGAVAAALMADTGLPAYEYTGSNALRLPEHPAVWARNLLANRLYECPVVYVEPYVMNSPEVFTRVQAGDYPGVRKVGGLPRKSIFREYADAVASGVAAYYRQRPVD